MKEAFEKTRKRIEEIWVDNRCGDCVYKSVCDKVQEEAIVNDQTDLCVVTIKSVALSIVSEVEAEYGNGCEKRTYEICLNGCDDDTTFKMDLTESEYQFLLRVSELANETSTYGCMPRMYVKEYTTTTD